jgi:putative membrane protein insertion efficiency factor
MRLLLKWSIRAYQTLLSPYIGWHCRFEPSCSHYALEALDTHGALKGSLLTMGRLCRCRPGGGFGADPVPLKK